MLDSCTSVVHNGDVGNHPTKETNMSNINTRSNKQTAVLFVSANATHADRIYGGGFGAYCKMQKRMVAALTGWAESDYHLDTVGHKITNRKTGEVVNYQMLEA